MKHVSRGIYLFALFALLSLGMVTLALAQETSSRVTPKPREEAVEPVAAIQATAVPREEIGESKPSTSSASSAITGIVLSDDEPVAGARVRVQATENLTESGEDGTFTLYGLATGETVTVTAWSAGHYNGWTQALPGEESIVITLTRYHQTDNHAYEWFEHEGVEGSQACGSCHPSYKEWQVDGHGGSALNYRFLSMYAGTDANGNQSPPPKKTSLGIPLAPDPEDPYHGPGFKLDFPNNAGKCATCHAPMAAKIANAQGCGWLGCHKDSTAAYAGSEIMDPGVSPMGLHGDAAEGIACDFCHKISQVYINRETGLPYPDRPGVLSYKLHRPPDGKDIFFGPLDDVSQPKDTFQPVYKESEYCAGCHYGILGDVVIGDMQTKGGVLVYSSFAEWLESPYSDEETGATCQDCHMPADGDVPYFVWPSAGGVIRDPSQVHNHTMLPVEMLQDAVTLTATAVISDGQLLVDVEVFNDKTGHHMPTDSPLRHAILVVEAKNDKGRSLNLVDGPQLPEWTGNYADMPGRAYAKLLRDKWTDEMPTGAIWRPVEIEADTRIPAMEGDTSSYVFRAPTNGIADVDVKLVYRRAFQQLMEWKDWDDPDIVMEETTLQVQE